MSKQSLTKSRSTEQRSAILLGTGLAVASLILVPAVAARIGLGSSFTGALRIALMKASSRATHGDDTTAGSDSGGFSCH